MNRDTWIGRRIYCWKLKRRWSRERVKALENENDQLRNELRIAHSKFDGVEKVVISEAAFKLAYGNKPIDLDNVKNYFKSDVVNVKPEQEPEMKIVHLTLPTGRRAGKTKGAKKCAN